MAVKTIASHSTTYIPKAGAMMAWKFVDIHSEKYLKTAMAMFIVIARESRGAIIAEFTSGLLTNAL